MTPEQIAQAIRMANVANALGEAATIAWSEGRLKDAAKLYARFEIAESRAEEFVFTHEGSYGK